MGHSGWNDNNWTAVILSGDCKANNCHTEVKTGRRQRAKQTLSEVVKKSATGLYLCVRSHANTSSMLLLWIWKSSYLLIIFLENLLMFNFDVNLEQVSNQSANGRQLLGNRLKTRKTFYPSVWWAEGFRWSWRNIHPTKIYDNQWQPFAEFKQTFWNLWQPNAEQRFWEVVDRSATGIYLCVTGALKISSKAILWLLRIPPKEIWLSQY